MLSVYLSEQNVTETEDKMCLLCHKFTISISGPLYTLIQRTRKGPADEMLIGTKWVSTRENFLRKFSNNKGADQPAYPRSLISAFVIRFLDSIISNLLQVKFHFSSYSL